MCHPLTNLTLNLLPQYPFERDRIRREVGDALTQLVDGHGVLVEVEAEERLVREVGLLLDVKALRVACIELFRHVGGGVEEIFEKFGL